LPGEADALLAADTSVTTGRTLEEIASSKTSKVWHSSRKKGARNDEDEAPAEPAAIVKKKIRHRAPQRSAREQPENTKARPMPSFVEPQLARLVDEPPVGTVWAHEIKFDGYRMQLRAEKRQAVLRTRKALDWSHRFRKSRLRAVAY